MKNKALFLDKDGVINKLVYDAESGIIHSPFTTQQVEYEYGIFGLLKKAKDNGYKIIVISNQPNIGIKKMNLVQLNLIKSKIDREFKKKGIKIDYQYYCMHHPYASILKYKKICRCRKPGTLLFEKAVKKFNIDIKKSFSIGDGISDVIASKKMKIKSIMIINTNEGSYLSLLEEKLGSIKPDYLVKNLKEIESII